MFIFNLLIKKPFAMLRMLPPMGVFDYFFTDLHMFKWNSLELNSGRLQLTSENMTYDIQIPTDLITPGKCDYIWLYNSILTMVTV